MDYTMSVEFRDNLVISIFDLCCVISTYVRGALASNTPSLRCRPWGYQLLSLLRVTKNQDTSTYIISQ